MSDNSRAALLIVDDDPASLYALSEMLAPLGAEIVTASSGEQALECVARREFAAILMDVRMPGIDGFTTARMIRDRDRSKYTPIIFITGAGEDVASMLGGYKAGAADFIAKPPVKEILRSKLAVFLGLHDMNRMLEAELAERSMTEQRLRTSEENLRALAAHLQSVREEERIHIAREIHDELGQALTGLKFDIESLSRCHEAADTLALAGKTQSMCQAIDRIINSVRRIASGLRPEVLDEIGLAAALEWQAREFSRRTGIRCSITVEPGFVDPDQERSTALFRIFQELLTNVARHANATRVTATIGDGEMLRLTVEDNGRGIRRQEHESAKSLGFMGLRERALAIGGAIAVQGDEGKGTRVSVSIPLTAHQPVFQA